jgi:predicted glutamine amidotransferase
MCVIICIDDGNFPSKKTLKSAEDMNSHGGSIAWLNKDGTKSYKKGIKAKEITKIINTKLIPKGVSTAIIHFRIASVGGVKKDLNHPFEISSSVTLNMENMNTQKDLLFHNGTWSEYTDVLVDYLRTDKKYNSIPRGNYSDSRIMAYLAHKMGVKKMARKVKGWNKIAVLTSKGITKYGEGWCKYKGNACSNNYFIPFKQPAQWENGFPSNFQYNSAVTTVDPLGYLNADELIEMTNIMDLYGVTEMELADMLADGSSIYDIANRLDQEEKAWHTYMDIEDEVTYYNKIGLEEQK